MAKYGTFMKTEDFGSKFYCGKKLTPFPEPPLHYVQGKTMIKSDQHLFSPFNIPAESNTRDIRMKMM